MLMHFSSSVGRLVLERASSGGVRWVTARMAQRKREQLVGSQSVVVTGRAVHDVVEPAAPAGKAPGERCTGAHVQRGDLRRIPAKPGVQRPQHREAVHP